MRNWRVILSVLCVAVLISASALAENADAEDLPWEKAYFNGGVFFAALDSSFRLGETSLTGIGIEVDVEDFLGLSDSETSFRIDAGWRFSKNLRHKIEFSWFSLHRDGTGILPYQVQIPTELQPPATVGPGATSAVFDFDIYKLKYEYSFILDDRVDLNLGLGLYVMPIEFGYTEIFVGGVGGTEAVEDITAPLPVFGLGFDFAITPQWFLRQQLDIFYLEIGDFSGGITDLTLALEYLPWKHVGFGLGVEALDVLVEASGSDWPGVDFQGRVKFDYIGALLYLKVYL